MNKVGYIYNSNGFDENRNENDPKSLVSNSRTLSSSCVFKNFAGLISAFHKENPLIINFSCEYYKNKMSEKHILYVCKNTLLYVCKNTTALVKIEMKMTTRILSGAGNLD